MQATTSSSRQIVLYMLGKIDYCTQMSIGLGARRGIDRIPWEPHIQTCAMLPAFGTELSLDDVLY